MRRWARVPAATLVLVAAVATLVGVPQASAVSERALHGRVTIDKFGTGEGRVWSMPGGIDCGNRCAYNFVSNDGADYEPVVLTATPEPGSAFDGWNFGDCGKKSQCIIDPLLPKQVYEFSVSFTRVRPSQFPLTVSVTGQGRVTSAPAGIDCGQTCSRSFAADSNVTLTAAPSPAWTFIGWGGACVGSGTCTVKMADPRSVTAAFAAPGTAYTLAVATAGGLVTSDNGAVSCGESCVAWYTAGTEVTLTPVGSPVAWAGACSGTGACVIPMTKARAVAGTIGGAQLTRVPVAVAVTGTGTVRSDPAGIDCGKTCGASLPMGAPVTLQAVPARGWLFAGWGGSCRGVESTCELSGKVPASASATFVRSNTRYTVALTKAGKGLVTSRPAGIRCGSRCSFRFLAGKTVALVVEPSEGWSFAGWSGACTGRTRMCTLGMDGPKSASVAFGRPSDLVPPRVTALPAEGEAGATARLRYRVSDQSGRSRETATVYAGQKRLAVIRGPLHEIDPDVLYYVIPWPNAVAAATRFCITSTDPTGNVSKPSCAPLRVS